MLKSSLILSFLFCISLMQPVVIAAPDTIPCPTLAVHYPADAELQKPFVLLVEIDSKEWIVLRGQKIRIYDRKSLSYNWKLSAGEILEGQGTALIKVDLTNVTAKEVTATVEVNGVAPECLNKATSIFRFDSEGNLIETSHKP